MNHVELRGGAYADSVTLLQVSRTVQGLPGVAAAQVAMATPLNVDVLSEMGFDVPAEAGSQRHGGRGPARRRRVAGDGLAGVDAALRRDRPARERPQRGGTAADDGGCAAAYSRRDRAGLRARTLGVRRGDGRARVRPRRDDLQRQRAARPGDRAQAVRRRARSAGDGSRLRDRGRRRPRVSGSPTSSRPARSGSSPRPAPAASSCSRCSTTPASGSPRRSASAAATCPPRSAAWPPVRRCAGWTRTPAVELIVLVSKPPAPTWSRRSRRTPRACPPRSSWRCSAPGQPDLTAAAEAVLRRLGRDVPAWPVRGVGRGAVRRAAAARAVRRRHAGRRGEAHRDRGTRRGAGTPSWTSATTPTPPAARTR